MGPISTGLGEIYMWTVAIAACEAETDGSPGWQATALISRRKAQRLNSDVERAAYLRTVQDWIIRPQIKSVPGVAGVDAIGGYVKQYHVQPDPAKLIALGLSFGDVAQRDRSQQRQPRRQRTSSATAKAIVVRTGGRLENHRRHRRRRRQHARRRAGPRPRHRRGRDRRRDPHRQRQRERPRGRRRNGADADRRQQPHRGGGGRRQDATRSRRTLPPGIEVKTVLNRTQLVDATIGTVATNLAEGALLVIAVLFRAARAISARRSSPPW